MPRDVALLINIVEHARTLRFALEKHGRTGFDADPVIQMGFAHLLQIIGEAARLIPDDVRSRYPTIPWKQIVGMRHMIVHEYFRIDYSVV